jgi:hypothetical protein
MRDCKTCQFYDVSGVKIQLKGSEKSIVVVVKMQEETQPGPNKLHRLSLVSDASLLAAQSCIFRRGCFNYFYNFATVRPTLRRRPTLQRNTLDHIDLAIIRPVSASEPNSGPVQPCIHSTSTPVQCQSRTCCYSSNLNCGLHGW